MASDATLAQLTARMEELLAERRTDSTANSPCPLPSALQRLAYEFCGTTGQAAADACWEIANAIVWEVWPVGQPFRADKADAAKLASELLVRLALARLGRDGQ